MTHTHTNGHTTTIKMNRVLIQAIAQIRQFTRNHVADVNARLSASFNEQARRGV